MPKAVRKDPDPAVVPKPVDEEEKSEPIKPLAEEEKENKEPPGPQEPVMEKEPDPAPKEDEEFEDALKMLGERFDRMEKAITSLGEVLKANYTSKPKPMDADYPTPPLDGPKSDGLQAPKIDQEINPAAKPFGKGKPASEEVRKAALAGAADGSRETKPPVATTEDLRAMRLAILKGETSIAKENAKLAQRKYGGN
jgi:hypothetical protein